MENIQVTNLLCIGGAASAVLDSNYCSRIVKGTGKA
jgi:hypothetical protein